MRPFLVALCVSAALPLAARAAELQHFEDAALHAVWFVDRDEGWVAGDEGVVWHTIDGGATWERQPTGVRASLRSLHFLNPYTGWAAGREDLPGGASAGVLLFTRDGGLKWQRVTLNALPGLHCVRFLDNKVGFVAGDGSDAFPTGLFQTGDCGRTWHPVPGPRCPAWLAADFTDEKNGALAGAWNRLAMLRQGRVVVVDEDTLGGRNLRGLHISGRRAAAVGQGGLVLLSDNTMENSWGVADLGLPREVSASWDFHTVYRTGNHIWAAGRPGSAVLHSGDGGASWEVQRTGQPLPLEAIHFADEKRGWAVGEYGTILSTNDGGKTWQPQRRGGQRAAVLFVHARSAAVPVDAVALLGHEDGYLATAVRLQTSDPASAPLGKAAEGPRLAGAVRQAGGAAAELLWQFPVPEHLTRAEKAELVKSWDRLHGDRAADQLLRQLVLALRVWRPAVVVTDNPDLQNGTPLEALVVEAVQEAFNRAADAKAFPEHVQQLGLEPWQPVKLYACCPSRANANVTLDLNEPGRRLEATPRDFAAPAAALLADGSAPPPTQRHFRLLDSKLAGAAGHHDLLEGIVLPPGGVARRMLGEVPPTPPELAKALETRRNLQALAEAPPNGLVEPARVLAQLGSSLNGLPTDQAAPAAYAVANQYARLGQWVLAREAFLLMVDRYPAHPLSVEAYRWLIRHGGSSEARRRHELGQFLVLTKTEFQSHQTDVPIDNKVAPAGLHAGKDNQVEIQQTKMLTLLGQSAETRRWYQGCLEIEPRLAAFGPLYATDPSIQFCLQAARRNLGDFDTARKWYARFVSEHPDGPWREAAAMELWLGQRTGPAPRPAIPCRSTETRPFLDGNLEDACWQHKPAALRSAVGDTVKEYPTEVWTAYDKDFFYLALRCKHPADRYVAPVKVRQRDADLRPYDRVSVLLDLDRDYSTFFHLQIDQRGCLCEDCWGDLNWNPRWFVAVQSDANGWTAEAAIPLIELTGDRVTVGQAWACNVVRVLPGRGVQGLSLPADVQPRPEGMGALIFTQDNHPAAAPAKGP
jgi:photosystem II stability/assembly factor-like uncharacterized protein/tetratricopeptide (TPR) repeat protein